MALTGEQMPMDFPGGDPDRKHEQPSSGNVLDDMKSYYGLKDMSDAEALKVLHGLHGEQLGDNLGEFAKRVTGGRAAPSGPVGSFLHGAIDTGTLGFGKWMRQQDREIRDAIGDDVPEVPGMTARRGVDLEDAVESAEHPIARTAGQVAGFAAPALVTAGAGVPAAAASGAARLGAGAFGQAMARAGAEGALLNSGYAAGRDIDEGKSGSDIAKDAAEAGLIGAAIPGGVYGVGRGLGAAGRGLMEAGGNAAVNAVRGGVGMAGDLARRGVGAVGSGIADAVTNTAAAGTRATIKGVAKGTGAAMGDAASAISDKVSSLANSIMDKPLSVIGDKLSGLTPALKNFVVSRASQGRQAVEEGLNDLVERDPEAANALARAFGMVKNAVTSEPVADITGHVGNVLSTVGGMMPANPIGRVASMAGAGLGATSSAMNAARAARGLRAVEDASDVAGSGVTGPAARAVEDDLPEWAQNIPERQVTTLPDAVEHAINGNLDPLVGQLGLNRSEAATLQRNLSNFNLDDPKAAAFWGRLIEHAPEDELHSVLLGLSRDSPDAFIKLSSMLHRMADVAEDPTTASTVRNVANSIGHVASSAAGFVPNGIAAGLNRLSQAAPAIGAGVGAGLGRIGGGLRSAAQGVEGVGDLWRRADPQMTFDFGQGSSKFAPLRDAAASSFAQASSKIADLARRGQTGLAQQLQQAQQQGPLQYVQTLFKLRGNPANRAAMGEE